MTTIERVKKTFSNNEPSGRQERYAASIDTIQKGNNLSDRQIQTLTDAAINEFTKDGPPLTREQRNEFQNEVKKIFSPESSAGSNEEPSHVSLKDYADTFSSVYALYGLEKHAAKLRFLEGVMMTRSVMGQLIGPIINKEIREVFTNSPSTETTGERNTSHMMSPDEQKAFTKDVRKLTVLVGGAVAGLLSATILDGAARKEYEKETLSLRKAINDRVANSVFMRDLEFVQDKTPAEILNVIDRGKRGTMTIINETYTEIIPHTTSIVAASGAGFGANWKGGVLGLLRLPLLYFTSKEVVQQMLADRKRELAQKDAIDARVLTSLQSIELVKASDTIENAIGELGKTMHEQDEIIIESKKKRVTRGQQEAYFDVLFEDLFPIALGYMEYTDLVRSNVHPITSALLALQQYRTISSAERGLGWHSSALMRTFSERIQPALQDVKQMEELLGPYDTLDKPDGLLEQGRMPVTTLSNFDIRVRNLHFKNILHNVSIDIPQGSFVTIRGPSGIGKTTFLRHILGLFTVADGEITYGGKDVGRIKKYGEQSMYSKLAYANQNPQYFENMTLRENLLLWTKKDIPEEKLRNVLRDLKLEYIIGRMDSKVKHFSGGELRRIGIARALLKDPKVLFLDEPTANLDEESATQVLDIIKTMRKDRPDMTVIAVTHDPAFEKIAEKIVDFEQLNQKPPTIPREGQVLEAIAKPN